MNLTRQARRDSTKLLLKVIYLENKILRKITPRILNLEIRSRTSRSEQEPRSLSLRNIKLWNSK